MTTYGKYAPKLPKLGHLGPMQTAIRQELAKCNSLTSPFETSSSQRVAYSYDCRKPVFDVPYPLPWRRENSHD